MEDLAQFISLYITIEEYTARFAWSDGCAGSSVQLCNSNALTLMTHIQSRL